MLRPGWITPIGALAGWAPQVLGASLFAFWDAERPDLIAESGGLVSSWRDAVTANNAAQSTGASKPTYSATGFNGRPCVSYDATDDDLTSNPAPAALPIGAAVGEIWAVVDQTAPAADTVVRCVTGYFDIDGGNVRRLARVVLSGVNRANVQIGTGSGEVRVANTFVDFSGRHVVRARIGATASQIDVDGIAGTPMAVVPVTQNLTLTLGRSPTALNSYWSGSLNAVLYTAALGAADAALLYAYLNRRL